MLYGTLEFLLNFANWHASHWAVFLIGVMCIGALVATKMTHVLRVLLVLPVIVETIYLTPTFACARSQMFTRAPGTQEACGSQEYMNYLAANFGLNHWYAWVAYIGLALFMLWPLLRGPHKTDKATLARNAQYAKDGEKALKRIDTIKHIG